MMVLTLGSKTLPDHEHMGGTEHWHKANEIHLYSLPTAQKEESEISQSISTIFEKQSSVKQFMLNTKLLQ